MAISRKFGVQLEGRFTKIARTFARNHKIDVRLVGTRCDTDEKGIIRLPANADYLKDDAAELLEGLLDHEWSHQFEETEARESGGTYPSPLAVIGALKTNKERLLFNAFEDIRIEAKQGARYFGVGENLREIKRHTFEDIVKPLFAGKKLDDKGRPVPLDPWYGIVAGIIGRAQGVNTDFMGSFNGILDMCADEIAACPSMKTANDARDLALKVLAKIKDMAKGEPSESGDLGGEGEPKKDKKDKGGKSKQKGSSEPSGDEDEDSGGLGGEDDEGGSSGDEDGEGEGEGGSDEEESDGSEDGDGDAGGDEGAEGKDGKGKDGKGKGKKPSKEESDLAKRLTNRDATSSDIVEESKKSIREEAEYDIEENRRHVPHPQAAMADRVEKMPARHEADYHRYMNEVRPQVSALRAKILTVLQSRKARVYIGDQERGGLDASSLYSLRLGNKRVFTKKVQAPDINTVIGILVDQSGSMGPGDSHGEKSNVARKATMALGETLHKVNIPFAIWGFHNDMAGVGHIARGDTEHFNRFEAGAIQLYKGFDENFNKTRTRLMGITGHGNNADGDHVIWAARQMLTRREERKILIVLSDGQPAASGDCNLLAAHLRDTVKACIAAGIEVFGIGIQTDAVKQFYPDYIVTHDLATLAPDLFRMMKKYLLDAPNPSKMAKRAAK